MVATFTINLHQSGRTVDAKTKVVAAARRELHDHSVSMDLLQAPKAVLLIRGCTAGNTGHWLEGVLNEFEDLET